MQKYLNSVCEFNNNRIDVDLNLFREMPFNIIFHSIRWYSHLTGVPINMNEGDTNKIYELTIPITKTGCYRLTARFKTSDLIPENNYDANNWIWYGLRDHAIVVSPTDARNIRLYEINVFNIDANSKIFFGDLKIDLPSDFSTTSFSWTVKSKNSSPIAKRQTTSPLPSRT